MEMRPLKTTYDVALVLSDVDGTLLTNQKVLTPRTKEAVLRLRAAGMTFSIASSRPPAGLREIIENLDIDAPIGALNGGLFVNRYFTELSTRFLTRVAALRALDLVRRHELVPWLFTDTNWYAPDLSNRFVRREAQILNSAPAVIKDFDPLLDRAVKVVGVSTEENAVLRLAKPIQRELDGLASVVPSNPHFLDITHPEATKGGVVEFLSHTLLIPKEAIATIGDMPNDVLMFEQSGLSIAMGNASDEVMACADFVTASNEENGFAYAMENLVLRRQK
jgi:Cof subfamily protein (haloacid dehalogenase superfamily)